MDIPEHFEMAEGYACHRPVGQVSLQEAIDLISRAIAFSRDHQIRRLLVNATGLTGFEPPGTWERFWLATQFAEAARSAVKVALVTRAEMIDPQRFGVTVARNRGLLAQVFTSEGEAWAWLLDPGIQ